MNKDNKINEKTEFDPQQNKGGFFKLRGLSLFSAFFWAFFLALAISNVLNPYLSQIISGLLSGITPLLIGIVVAFIFYRMVDFIEKKLLKNAFKSNPYKFGIKRTISITMVCIVIFAIIALLFYILIPKVIDIIQRITAGNGDGGTQIYHNVVNEIYITIQRWFGTEVSQENIMEILNSIFEWFLETVGYIGNLMELSINLLTGFFNCLMGFLLAIFILKDKEKISRFSRRFVYANMKKEKADEVCVLTKNANEILYNYIICKFIEFGLIFVSLGITYMILGLEFTWELALIVGLFNFIPYFGIYIGGFISVLITLIFNSSINLALYMAIATVVITTVEFNTIIPFITGKRLKVSGLVVISSILIGGAMFGIIGMLLAPPIIALIAVIITGNIELKENRMKFVMELNKTREKNLKEEQEQLNLNTKKGLTSAKETLLNEKVKVSKDDESSKE